MTLFVTSVKQLEEIQIRDNLQSCTTKSEDIVDKDNRLPDIVDLTKESPKKLCKTTLANNVAESCVKDCISNKDVKFDIETASSWTSSSDDILYLNNS